MLCFFIQRNYRVCRELGFSKAEMGKLKITCFLTGCFVASVLFLVQGNDKDRALLGVKTDSSETLTINQLLSMSPEQLKTVDIALMNLTGAAGLKGSEQLNIDQSLSILNDWAEQVLKDTDSRLPAFRQNPGKYNNSENLFRIVNMILYLKNQIGVDYNQDIMQREDFPDSRDVFIHGCLTGSKQGGCISIPILCVSVGRRLGYPLKLVLTKQHVFFRWDDSQEVFNMEACCPGCDTYPDEYYKNWPDKITEEEIRANGLLKSLTPTEELALFLETRGHCLFDTGQTAEAQVMYAYAYKLMPTQVKLTYMNRVIQSELNKMRKQSN